MNDPLKLSNWQGSCRLLGSDGRGSGVQRLLLGLMLMDGSCSGELLPGVSVGQWVLGGSSGSRGLLLLGGGGRGLSFLGGSGGLLLLLDNNNCI